MDELTVEKFAEMLCDEKWGLCDKLDNNSIESENPQSMLRKEQ